MLEFDNVSVGYGQLTVIHDVSFHVAAGEVVSLVGSNGAAKKQEKGQEEKTCKKHPDFCIRKLCPYIVLNPDQF